MSKQSMPGDKTGWKRGAGTYSRSYADLTGKDNPDSKVERSGDIDRASGNGYAKALPKAGKNKGGGTY